jgi:hypothetical protein
MYAAICVAGVVVAVHPPRRAKTGHITREEPTLIGYQGHHPTCGRFVSHVLQFQNRTVCAGCSGLEVGALLSLVGSMYFFSDGRLGGISTIVYVMGVVFVGMGILQYSLIRTSRGVVHFLTNALFVVGTALLLIGFNEINGSVLIFYLFASFIFWIIARIVLSQVEHDRICRQCGRRCIDAKR